ncbi:hypothetical protein [Sedimenticola hydrogenitrophicus]|uniref:hypothetical protein n=1 Tax=Sedimenticola hydrogenitrophicus TaxID=2967975 RepID=UPI0023B1E7A3|nr:hypothetical protein [Sedimenticola hydrogenitrophicus]
MTTPQQQGTIRANVRRARIRRLREDIARIEKHMPHRGPDTQRRAEDTLAPMTAELKQLEMES